MIKNILAKVFFSKEILTKSEKLHFLLLNKKISPDDFSMLINSGLNSKVISCWRFLYEKEFNKLKFIFRKYDTWEDEDTVENPVLTKELCEFVKDLRKSSDGLYKV